MQQADTGGRGAAGCAGSVLVSRTIQAMVEAGCEEVALEAEVTNSGALRLYQKLGFVRDKRLQRWPAGQRTRLSVCFALGLLREGTGGAAFFGRSAHSCLSSGCCLSTRG